VSRVLAPVVWAVAAGTAALQLATSWVYGYHRDEFYYLACGRRLAWGYVDHPPITPLLYRMSAALFGTSRIGLRVVPALLHGIVVLLVALLARELGGSARAQLLAALGAAVAPLFLTTSHFLGTVTVEIVAGTALSLVVVRLLGGADPRWWLAVGLVVGLGLLNKWTFGFLAVGLLVGLLVLPERSVLATPWAAAGGALAGVLVAPNLLWQARHGWPQLEFASQLRDYGQSALVAPAQLFLLGAVGVILVIPGVVWLVRDESAARYRPFLVALVVVVALVIATGGKPYYTAAILPFLVAAGAVTVAGTSPRGWLLPALLVATGLLLAPLAMPLLPRATAEAVRKVNPEIGEMLGWESLVDQVAAVHARHPGAAVLTRNYSEAGAIELLGADRGLPQPASGHNSYWDWGPPADEPVTVVVGFRRDQLHAVCGRVERAATFHTPGDVHNLEDGTPIWICRDRRAPWADLWPRLRHL
jgi:4-amino-4-deoxy-L-arabinose transferase-like glycosyltransferase